MRLSPLLSLTPGALLRLGVASAFGLPLTGCVAAKHYDEARAVAESEVAAHARTRSRLEAASERIATLEQELGQRAQALAAGESVVAESKLATTVALKEKEAAGMLIEELRTQLARTGEHLNASAQEKQALGQTLKLAEQRMLNIEVAAQRLTELVATTRDLALFIGEPLQTGGIELFAKEGQVVVGVPADKLFAANADALVGDAAPVLTAVGKVSALHPSLRVVLREPASASLASARVRRLGDALRERGVPDARLSLPGSGVAMQAPGAQPADAAGAETPERGATSDAEPASGAETASRAAPAAGVEAGNAPVPSAGTAAGVGPERYEIAFTF